MPLSEAPPLPYDFSSWYPLLRGSLDCRGVFHVGDSHGAEVVTETVSTLSPGESMLLVSELETETATPQRATLGAVDASFRGLGRRLAEEATMRRLGLERFHVLPNTGGGFVLLPVQNGRGYRAALDLLPGGRRRWRLARRVLRLGSALGWQAPPGAAEVLLVTQLPSLHALPASSALRGALGGVAAGVPGANQRIVVRLTEGGELPDRIVKLSKTKASRERIEREIDALQYLKRTLSHLGLAPRLLDEGEQGDTRFLVQETLRGQRSSDEIGTEHLDFIGQLHRRTLRRAPLRFLNRYRADRDLFEELDTLDDDCGSALGTLRASIEAYWGDRPIPCALAHGDFTPWNLRRGKGRLRAFDWEHLERSAPALQDLFHFVVQTGVLVRRATSKRILADVRELAFGSARPLVDAALLSPQDTLGAFALYLFHTTVVDEHARRVERPRFEQADWLRRTRLALANRLAAELLLSTDGRTEGAA